MKEEIMTSSFHNPQLDLKSMAKDEPEGNQHCRNLMCRKDKMEIGKIKIEDRESRKS